MGAWCDGILITAAVSVLSPRASTDGGQNGPRMVLESATGVLTTIPLDRFTLEAQGPASPAFVRPEGLMPPAAPGGRREEQAKIELVGGETLVAQVLGGAGDRLSVELVGGARLELEIDRIRSVVFDARVQAQTLASLLPSDRGDVLHWIRPGGSIDRVPGTLIGLETDGPRLEGRFGERSFPWKEVAALFVEPLDPTTEAPAGEGPPGLYPGAPAIVDLVDGSRLRGRLAALGAPGCRLELSGALPLELPLETVAEIVADDGRVVFLSELVPARTEEGSPFGDDLGLAWRHRRDASVSGDPLRAGGRIWRRGIGVHAPSRLTFELDGAWRELRGAAAIDDQVLLLGARGSVVFRVLAGSEVRWSSGVVRGGDPPLELPRIDLGGVRELTLEVEMATEFHVADRADWLRLVLVR